MMGFASSQRTPTNHSRPDETPFAGWTAERAWINMPSDSYELDGSRGRPPGAPTRGRVDTRTALVLPTPLTRANMPRVSYALREAYMRKPAAVGLACLVSSALIGAARPDVETLAAKCQAGGARQCAELAGLARSHREASVRRAAVARITDQAVLAEVAQQDVDVATCRLAIERLTDTTALAALARDERRVGIFAAWP